MDMSDNELAEARSYFAMAARGDGFSSDASVKKAGETGLRLVDEVKRLRGELARMKGITSSKA